MKYIKVNIVDNEYSNSDAGRVCEEFRSIKHQRYDRS